MHRRVFLKSKHKVCTQVETSGAFRKGGITVTLVFFCVTQFPGGAEVSRSLEVKLLFECWHQVQLGLVCYSCELPGAVMSLSKIIGRKLALFAGGKNPALVAKGQLCLLAEPRCAGH